MEFGNEEFEPFEDDVYRDSFSTTSESDMEGYLYSQVHYASKLDVDTKFDNDSNHNESMTVKEYPEIQRSDYFVLGIKEKHEKEAKPLFGANHWDLDELDMLDNNDSQKNFKYIPRYYLTSSLPNIFCYNCDEKGHLMRDCSKPKKIPVCYLCGGSHARHKCVNDLCYNCMNPGHISKDCKEPRSSFQQTCLRCNYQGHTKKNCPEIWRQYHLTVEDGQIIKPSKYKTNKARYCYNCASKKHFGEDCMNQRFSCRIYYSQFVVCYDKCSNSGRKYKNYKNDITSSEKKFNKQSSSHITPCKDKSSESLTEEMLKKRNKSCSKTSLDSNIKSNFDCNVSPSPKNNINSIPNCDIRKSKKSKNARKDEAQTKEGVKVLESLDSKKEVCLENKKTDRKRKLKTERINKESENKKIKINESDEEENDKKLLNAKKKKNLKDDYTINTKAKKMKEKKEKQKERKKDRKDNFKLFDAISSKVKKRKVENMWLNDENTIPNEIRFSMLKEFRISCDDENTDNEAKIPRKLNYHSFLKKIKEKGGIDFVKNEDFIPVGLATEEELRYTNAIKRLEEKYHLRRNRKMEKKKQIETPKSGKKPLKSNLDQVTLDNVRDIILFSDPEEEVDFSSQETILRSNPEINISDENVSIDHDLIEDTILPKKSRHNGNLIGCLTQYNPNEVHQDHLVTYGLIKPTQDIRNVFPRNGSQKNLKSVDETKRVHKKWYQYNNSNKKNNQLNSSKNNQIFRGFQSFMTRK